MMANLEAGLVVVRVAKDRVYDRGRGGHHSTLYLMI